MKWRGDNPANNFPQYDGGCGGREELQTWVRGAGIDIPISTNNESFPLGSAGGGGGGASKEEDRRRDGWMDGWMLGGFAVATHVGLHTKGNIPVYWH